jgi:CubicO group peptidase (beta-lactamase class C family)
LCVYVGTEKVVDLWHSDPNAPNPMFRAKEGAKWGPETVQMNWSAGKTVSSYAYAVAVSKGIVSYDQLVCRDWPEFGNDDSKKVLTAKEVLQHRAGFDVLDVPIDP